MKCVYTLAYDLISIWIYIVKCDYIFFVQEEHFRDQQR